jgi:hypothetical protein
MTRKGSKSQVAAERLLEERRQYEAWIAKLSEPGPSPMPPHVVDRVRADYRSRLEDVTRQLARYGRELEANLAELELRRSEMLTQRSLREEALAEIRLRHTVGEFDDAQYADLSADHTAQIAQLAEDLESTERDIARLQEVLQLVAIPEPEPEPPPPSFPPEPPRPRTSGAMRAPEIPAPAIPARRSGPFVAPAYPAGPPLDELAFIRSVAESGARSEPEPEPEPEPAPEPEPPPEPVEAEPAPTGPLDEAVPVPMDPPAAEQAAAPAGEDALGRPVQHMRLGESDGQSGGAARPAHLASRGVETEQAAPRRSDGEPPAKTLRCTECGTDNLPTEWYCEKCGAELSAF